MSFSALSSAWLFALLAPLVIFYFLKLKRPRQTISSLVLWRQVLSDQRVNSPFQRFKRNLLLLLQILLLALLVLAAMQPFLRRESGTTGRLPILIDVSASMGALDRDGGRTRLEEAKAQLRERINTLPSGQELCLIAFSKTARKLTDFTNNQTELRDALNALEVEDVPGELEEALQLTQAVARTSPFSRALVVTDGNIPARTSFELPFELTLQKLPKGGANAGVTACQARRNSAGDWELFVQLACTDPAPSNTATLTLFAGTQEIAKEQVNLVAGGAPRLSFKLAGEQGTAGNLIHAVLAPTGFDSLSSDNEAWLSLPATRPLDVFVPENLAPFRQALGGLDGLRLFPQKDVPSPSSFDLAIGDTKTVPTAVVTCSLGELPEELKPLVTMRKDPAQSVRAIDWRRESPLLQYVSFDEVLFLDDPTLAADKDATALRVLGWEMLVDGPRGPLMLAHLEERSARIHLLFQLDHSTLPYRVAFPIFVSNLVAASLKLAGLSEASAIATGVLPPQPAPALASVSVRGPKGLSREEKASERGMLTGVPASRAGEYQLTVQGTTSRLGASLLSSAETGLSTVDEVAFGDRISVAAESSAPKGDRSLWWILAAVGYTVLLLEWWWFQRRPF